MVGTKTLLRVDVCDIHNAYTERDTINKIFSKKAPATVRLRASKGGCKLSLVFGEARSA